MALKGWDISNHQYMADVGNVIRLNNLDFTFILTNDGTFRNAWFAEQYRASVEAGALTVGYVYMRPNWPQTMDIALAQVDAVGSKHIIIDFEDGSGDAATLVAAHVYANHLGYTTPVQYTPKYIWQQIGSPNLATLPPLWKSWYADNLPREYDEALRTIPSYVWDDYGNQHVEILQFTGTGRLLGYGGNLDLNYYRGTRPQLEQLLQLGASAGGGGGIADEGIDDMYLALGNASDRLYAITVTPEGYFKRHVKSPVEADFFKAAGVKQVNGVDQVWLDGIWDATEASAPASKGEVAKLKAQLDALTGGAGYTLDQIGKAAADATAPAVVAELKKEGN